MSLKLYREREVSLKLYREREVSLKLYLSLRSTRSHGFDLSGKRDEPKALVLG
jgi:hypothetical protein